MKNIPKIRRFIPDIHLKSPLTNAMPGFFADSATITHPELQHGHRHLNVELNFMKSGTLTYMMGGRLQMLREGETAVLWANYPHRIQSASNRAEVLWAIVPIQKFLGWRFPRQFHQRLLGGELLVDSVPMPEQDHALFKQWCQDQKNPHPGHEEIMALEFHARLRRLECRLRHGNQRSKRMKNAANVTHFLSAGAVKMASYVARHFHERISLGNIAGAAGLHPNYAARLFRSNFGVSTGRFLAEYRIAHAQTLLQTTDAKVLDIALASGFQSSSRFYATFQSLAGKPPKTFRRN